MWPKDVQQGSKGHLWGKDSLFNKWFLENWIIDKQVNEVGPLLTPI